MTAQGAANAATAQDRPPQGGLSLRTLLSFFLVAVAAYVLVFSGIVAFRIAPAARAMLDGSHTTVATWVTRTGLDSVVLLSLEDAREVVRSAGEGRATDERRREVAGRLRSLADSTWLEDAARALARAPQAEVSEHLATAASAYEELAAALLDAAADIQAGRDGLAARALARAEERRRVVTGHLLMIEKPALYELFEGERLVVETVNAVRRLVLWWAVGAALLVGALAIVAHRRLYRPLRELEAGLERVGAGDLAVTLPQQQSDELGRLAGLFNRTTRMLADRSAQQRRYSENLAERLGRILDDSSSEIVVFDGETLGLTQLSNGAQRNLGASQAEAAALNAARLFCEFTSDSLRAALAPLREGREERILLSTLVQRLDGTTYPADISLHYSRREVPPVFVAVIQDISERLQLREERDRIFELSVDLLVAARTDGTLLRMNPAYLNALGYSAAELGRRSFYDLLHAEDAAKVAEAVARTSSGESIRGLVVRMVRKDGQLRWVSWSCSPPMDGVLYSVGRDVTADHEAEAAQERLQAAIERVAHEWTQTFDAIEHPILIADESGRVVRLNDGVRRLVGARPAELVGRRIGEIGPGELWARAEVLVADVQRDGTAVATQVRSAEAGRTWTVEATPVRLGADRLNAVIVVIHDVTRVVAMQESLRRNETMAELGSLLAGVAHEVRNPLFSMTATLDAFEARHGGAADGQHFRVLRSQLARMQQLMQDLLDYGRPGALDPVPTSTHEILAQAAEAASVLAEQRGVRLELAAHEQTIIPADRDRLVQVFVNLLLNAVQYSPSGSAVSISAAVSEHEGGQWVEVTVSDQGPGFTPSDLPLVFEPFFSRRKGGTGLGLSIARRLVEQHGGRISVENAPAGGAVTRVRLPVRLVARAPGGSGT